MKCRIASSRKLEKERAKTVNKSSPVAVASMLMVCEKRLRFGYLKMRWAVRYISDQFDLVNQGYMNYEDYVESLRDYYGVNVDYDLKTPKTCNTLDDAQRIATYTQKAFATAILCTVLCEKFGFGRVKTQQAVKQFCTIFDEMKQDKNALTEYEKHLHDVYQIGLHEKEDKNV